MTVSHELRTPLTAIYGWARMLSTGQIRDAQRPRAIDAIERNAAALQQLVNDLLDVSRVVSGKLRLDVEPVLAARRRRRGDRRDPPGRARQEHRRGRRRSREGDLAVSGDAGRLQQVVWNLLSNAVRFTPAGGRIDDRRRARRRRRRDRRARHRARASTPQFLPHAFERFRQGASGTTRAHGGLGLGLAIVRHLVELHGGTVEAIEQHAGARRDVPHRAAGAAGCAPRARRRRAGGRARRRASARRARLDGVRVLVTDDDMNARELLAVILENAGAEVRAAASAEDALMILQTWTPDVVLSDIEMPGEDGYGLIEQGAPAGD